MRTRIHYAWIILGVTFLTLPASAGVRAAPGVLIIPLGVGLASQVWYAWELVLLWVVVVTALLALAVGQRTISITAPLQPSAFET